MEHRRKVRDNDSFSFFFRSYGGYHQIRGWKQEQSKDPGSSTPVTSGSRPSQSPLSVSRIQVLRAITGTHRPAIPARQHIVVLTGIPSELLTPVRLQLPNSAGPLRIVSGVLPDLCPNRHHDPLQRSSSQYPQGKRDRRDHNPYRAKFHTDWRAVPGTASKSPVFGRDADNTFIRDLTAFTSS